MDAREAFDRLARAIQDHGSDASVDRKLRVTMSDAVIAWGEYRYTSEGGGMLRTISCPDFYAQEWTGQQEEKLLTVVQMLRGSELCLVAAAKEAVKTP